MSCSCGTKPSSSTSTFCSTCAPGALAGGLVRTRFFDGMVLTQSDLENEQRYWRIKRRLTNRALGEGVVWGLRVRWDAARRVFVLGPGYALDCCGNDLVVECPVQIAEADLIKLADPLYRSATPRSSKPRRGTSRTRCAARAWFFSTSSARKMLDRSRPMLARHRR